MSEEMNNNKSSNQDSSISSTTSSSVVSDFIASRSISEKFLSNQSVIKSYKTEPFSQFDCASNNISNDSSITNTTIAKCPCISVCECIDTTSLLMSSNDSLSHRNKLQKSFSMLKKPGWKKLSSSLAANKTMLSNEIKSEKQDSLILSNSNVQSHQQQSLDSMLSYSDSRIKPFILRKSKSIPKHQINIDIKFDPKTIEQAERIDEFLNDLSIIKSSSSSSSTSLSMQKSIQKQRSKSWINDPFNNINTLTLKRIKIFEENVGHHSYLNNDKHNNVCKSHRHHHNHHHNHDRHHHHDHHD